MIREHNLERFLACLVEELNGTVRPELSTDHARKVVDSLVLMAGRMVANFGPGRSIADDRVPQWEEIGKDFERLGLGRTFTLQDRPNRLAALDSAMSAMQADIGSLDTFGRYVEMLRNGNAGALEWTAHAARGMDDLLQSMEDSQYRPQGRKGAASVADNIDELREALSEWLRSRYPGLPVDPIRAIDVASGGQIKRTAIITLKPNVHLPDRVVLRQDMPMNFTGTVVTDEFETLRTVHELGLPVPEPLVIEPDGEILGGAFMLMTEVAGAKQAGTYFAEERRLLGTNMGPEFGREMAGLLARLHSSTVDTSPEAGRKCEEERTAALNTVYEAWRQLEKPSFSLAMDLGFAWLKANPLGANRPRCLLHGDVGAHNAMTRDGHLVAMLDWELSSRGDPADDLAQARMLLLPDTMPWEDFKTAYLEQGGLPSAADDEAVAWFGIWTFARHGKMNAELWNYFVTGQRDDAAAAAVASHFWDRLALYSTRALRNAVEARGL
jgi:aminoglycoside phosphotransferase (APT) family kinase protein